MFGKNSTASEVLKGLNLHGKNVVVTGGSSGLGLETARALAAFGADVTIAVRDIDKGNRVAEDIKRQTNQANLHVMLIYCRPCATEQQRSRSAVCKKSFRSLCYHSRIASCAVERRFGSGCRAFLNRAPFKQRHFFRSSH